MKTGGETHLFPDQDVILILVTLGDLILHSSRLTGPYFLAHFLKVYMRSAYYLHEGKAVWRCGVELTR